MSVRARGAIAFDVTPYFTIPFAVEVRIAMKRLLELLRPGEPAPRRHA